MRYIRGNAVKGLHTGSLIQQKLREKNITVAELSRRINRSPSTVKPVLTRSSCQAYLLWEAGTALNYNFFQHLADLQNAQHADTPLVNGNPSDKAKIEALEKEVAQLREERDYLKKIIDVMARK